MHKGSLVRISENARFPIGGYIAATLEHPKPHLNPKALKP